MHLLLAAVVALALPTGATVDAQPARVPLRVSADGTIAATVTLSPYAEPQRVAVWAPHKAPVIVAPASALDPGELSAQLVLGGFDGAGTLYATLIKDMELEAGGNRSIPGLYPESRFLPLALEPCAAITAPDFLPHIEQVENDVIYLTYDSPDSMEVLDGDMTSDLAPYAVRLEDRSCTLLGRASLRGVAGEYASGFRGYFGAFNAPTDLRNDRQRYVAVRMHGGTVTELGSGVALAISENGVAVGADAPPDIREASCCTPHAMLWRLDGTSVALAPNARSSVAYAVDDAGTALGTLVDANGKRFAFSWQHGRLRVLDDALHAPGWHFDAAFAFGPGGEIVGIGTHDGKAALFVARP
jgi:hypothetical protein